jgi:predicted ATPase
MKISEIRFENFKCFDKLDLKLNKLTLLTGANSSGKSSAIYGMLTPFQSDNFPFYFSTNGKYINMGSFEDISYTHNKANIIKLGFTFREDKPFFIDTYWEYDKSTKQPSLNKLIAKELYYELTIKKNPQNKFDIEFIYFKDKDHEEGFGTYDFQIRLWTLMNEFSSTNKPTKGKDESWLKKLEEKYKRNNQVLKMTVNSINDLHKEINEKGSNASDKVMQTINMFFHNYDNSINYISSFRFHPRKIREELIKSSYRVGKYGDNYEDQLLYWESRKDPRFNALKNTLKELHILEDIKTSRIFGGNYELKVKTHKNGVFSSLIDVGFGISQFLPIIVSDLQIGKNSTLLISQPEIHLHPKIQSEFGNYLFKQIKDNNKSYIIETHSEYLINRIRLLIVQKKLTPNDVSVYYFQKKGNVVKKFELLFTIDGQIKNAPKDFFDTYMSDVFDIAMNSKHE